MTDYTARQAFARLATLALFACCSFATLVRAEHTEGILVSIPTSITSESTARLQSILHGPLKRFEAGAGAKNGRFLILCDFNPEGRRSDSSNFGACLDLAKYLRSIPAKTRNVSTVAYIRGSVTRHSVLPALACSEMVFSTQGKLGRITEDGVPLDKTEMTAYEDLVRGRKPSALVRKMYDPTLSVFQVGDDYKGSDERPLPIGEPLLPADQQPILYDFKLAARVGLCSAVAVNSLDALRARYGVSQGGPHRQLDRIICWRIPVDGAVDGGAVELTKRRIRRALEARANLLIFEINCAGGDSEKANDLGLHIANLNEGRSPDNQLETIAYVSNKARNVAAFVAFGCNKIVMQYEEGDAKDDEEDVSPQEARLGGFGLYLQRHPAILSLREQLTTAPDAQRKAALQGEIDQTRAHLEDALRKSLSDLAARQLHPAVLAEGMFSTTMKIHLVRPTKGAASGRMFLSEDDLKTDQAGPKQWASVQLVHPWQGLKRYEGRYLTLSARQAKEIEIADTVKDINDLYEREGLSPGRVQAPRSEWLDGLAEFLRHPAVSVLLVMVGIVCLILELKMPGVGLPGVLSAISFVLFFWAHSQLSGQITWLAILLFILGLVLLMLEVFVLPGFGVCGISGILLVLSGLGLIAYGHWPRSAEDWVAFGDKLWPFGISLLGSLGVVALIAKYLENIPVLNRLISKTPEEAENEYVEHPGHAELQALLGAIGVTATPLRPAGKTKFGDDFVDVVAEGGYVMPGTRVQVVEVEGNRVVVKQV